MQQQNASGRGLQIFTTNQSFAGPSIQISDAASTRFVIASNGNVGIGTNSPISILHTSAAYSIVKSQATGGDGNQAEFVIQGNKTWNFATNRSDVGGARENLYIRGDDTYMVVQNTSGNVGIGTLTPDSKLTVAGKIHSREVKVTVDAGADFVFLSDCKLKPLMKVAEYISVNKHLPEIAAADEMKKNGLELGEMNIKLLQKIEELTLYMIDFKRERWIL